MSIIMTKTWKRELRNWVHEQHDANFNDFANRRVAIEGYNASISHNVSDYAADFKVPTLLIIGSRDDITSPKQQFEMSQKISVPHAISQHMGVGHLTHYEIPSDVAQDIRQFVAQQEFGI
jgi:pimeloyl-ACP methyl ester carboxylesterase